MSRKLIEPDAVIALDPTLSKSHGIAREELRKRFPDYPPFTLKSVVATLLAQTITRNPSATGKNRRIALAESAYAPLLGSTLIYESNSGSGYRTKSSAARAAEQFRHDLFVTYDAAAAVAAGEVVTPKPAAPVETPKPAAPKPAAAAPANPIERFVQWCQHKARPFCESQNADGHKLDDWSMRRTLDGVRVLLAGGPLPAVLDSVTMEYPDAARKELGVTRFDFVKFGILNYLQVLAAAGVPIMMTGPKGTGKSTYAKLLADSLFIDFGMVSMTAGTSPSAFYGRPMVGGDGGVVESHFTRVYRDGGVFLFDEMDAADPNILLIVNAALANGQFFNPMTGDAITRNDGAVMVAATNTIGLGGSRDYTGRERLDAATLDRFAAGRVRVDVDTDLETRLVAEIVNA